MQSYSRLFWIQRVVILGLMVGIGMSFPLWFSDREFPLVPVIPGTLPLNQLGSQIALGLAALLLVLSFIWVKTRWLVLLSVAALLVIGLQDYNRLQPWYFQYLSLLIFLIPVARNYKKYIESDHFLFSIQIGIAVVYFFSALFKYNTGFYEKIVPYMYQPVTNILVTYRPLIHQTGYLIPPFEMAIALALFIPKLRFWGILGATALHLAILVLLGPIGIDANSIIWPWNIALIALIWLAFFRAKNYKYTLYLSRLKWHAQLMLIVVGVLPFLNLKGWYNESLSYELYSGRSFTPHLRYHHTLIQHTPEHLVPYTFKFGDTVFVNTYNWSIQTYNVPPNSDWKVIREVQAKTLKQFQQGGNSKQQQGSDQATDH